MKGEQRSITPTTNTILVSASGGSAAYPMSAIIKNPSGNGNLYLGHHGLTSSTGFPLGPAESLEVDIVNETLYGITTATGTIYILRRGD